MTEYMQGAKGEVDWDNVASDEEVDPRIIRKCNTKTQGKGKMSLSNANLRASNSRKRTHEETERGRVSGRAVPQKLLTKLISLVVAAVMI